MHQDCLFCRAMLVLVPAAWLLASLRALAPQPYHLLVFSSNTVLQATCLLSTSGTLFGHLTISEAFGCHHLLLSSLELTRESRGRSEGYSFGSPSEQPRKHSDTGKAVCSLASRDTRKGMGSWDIVDNISRK